MSELYVAAPVTLTGASIRLAWEPMWTRFSGQAGIGNALRLCGGGNSGRLQRGLQHAGISAATAKVPGAGMPDLAGRRAWILPKQRSDADDKTRRAKAAHQSILVHEGLLDRRQLAVLAQAFNRGNWLALHFDSEL